MHRRHEVTILEAVSVSVDLVYNCVARSGQLNSIPPSFVCMLRAHLDGGQAAYPAGWQASLAAMFSSAGHG